MTVNGWVLYDYYTTKSFFKMSWLHMGHLPSNNKHWKVTSNLKNIQHMPRRLAFKGEPHHFST